MQRAKWGYTALQWVTDGDRGSQEVTEGYKRLQGVTRCYRGI